VDCAFLLLYEFAVSRFSPSFDREDPFVSVEVVAYLEVGVNWLSPVADPFREELGIYFLSKLLERDVRIGHSFIVLKVTLAVHHGPCFVVEDCPFVKVQSSI